MPMLPLPPVPTQSETGSTQWLDYYFRLNKYTSLLGIGPYITNDDTTAVKVYPTWVSGSSNNLPVNISSATLSFIPSTGILTSTGFDGTIGTVIKHTGAFTTGLFTGQLTSTVSTGTAPLVIASTTQVVNLNSSLLLGGTWNSPGNIGSTAPATGKFTTLDTTGAVLIAGALRAVGNIHCDTNAQIDGGATINGNLVSGAFACNAATPQVRAPSGGAVSTTGATNAAPYGYTTAAQANDIITKLNTVIAALVANGIMS